MLDRLSDPGKGSWRLRQCSHDRPVEAINQPRAPVGDQPDFTGLARLEAHSRSRRNVQAIPESSLSIKGESRVGLGEMIMTADLDRSVAGVGDSKRDGRSILVQDDLARCRKNLARYHVSSHQSLRRIMSSLANWIVNAYEFGAIGERCFHLHLVDHFGDAFHDLIAGQDLAALGHEFGDRLAVACRLHDEIRYKRDAFGIVELDASCEPPSSDQRGERDHELVFFTRREVHALIRSMAGLCMPHTSVSTPSPCLYTYKS